MFRKSLTAFALAGMIAAGVASAQVTVRIAPPRPQVERRGPPPGRAYIWTPGYHRWDGRAYAWVPGAWVMPPRPHARWVAGHWVKRHHDWVFVEGHWR
jgi:hypothetical protein